MGRPALLACDWGTTNLRAWTLDDDGAVITARSLPLGVAGLATGEAARRFEAEVRPALGAEHLPAILCGMIGSGLGWTAVPYLGCPADLSDLAGALTDVGAPGRPVHIVPGVRCTGFVGAADVMRGEETQLMGWLAAEPGRRRGPRLVCHPGTHAKWMLVEDGRLLRFVTAMTGELYAVLARHSILKSDAPADDDPAFAEGLAAAGDGGALAARLFTARARIVGDQRPPESTPSYLSGLLIGAEVASVPGLLGVPAGAPIGLLGDGSLCDRYRLALNARGLASETFDGEAAAIAGLLALHRLRVSQ